MTRSGKLLSELFLHKLQASKIFKRNKKALREKHFFVGLSSESLEAEERGRQIATIRYLRIPRTSRKKSPSFTFRSTFISRNLNSLASTAVDSRYFIFCIRSFLLDKHVQRAAAEEKRKQQSVS